MNLALLAAAGDCGAPEHEISVLHLQSEVCFLLLYLFLGSQGTSAYLNILSGHPV